MIQTESLQKIMAKNNITARILAEKLGMSESLFSKKINNESPMTLTQAKNICDLLGIPSKKMQVIFFA